MSLLPCPFCGEIAAPCVGLHNFEDVVVMCQCCGAEGPMFDCDDGGPDERGRNEAQAMSAWNMRR